MLFQSNSFKTLEAGVQTSWMRQQVHVQNLTNIETAGYKSQRLEFQKVLDDAKSGSSKELRSIRAQIVTDEDSSVLNNGNNVDFDKESMELYKSYVQHSMLIDKISNQFENISYVLNNNMK